MIVDDVAEIRDVLRRRFAKKGFRILEANCGEEAIATVGREDVDLVILDLSMPEMSGIDVLRVFRASERSARLPVIIATGHIDPAISGQALEAGADHLVHKPVDFRSLLALVTELIEQARD